MGPLDDAAESQRRDRLPRARREHRRRQQGPHLGPDGERADPRRDPKRRPPPAATVNALYFRRAIARFALMTRHGTLGTFRCRSSVGRLTISEFASSTGSWTATSAMYLFRDRKRHAGRRRRAHACAPHAQSLRCSWSARSSLVSSLVGSESRQGGMGSPGPHAPLRSKARIGVDVAASTRSARDAAWSSVFSPHSLLAAACALVRMRTSRTAGCPPRPRRRTRGGWSARSARRA